MITGAGSQARLSHRRFDAHPATELPDKSAGRTRPGIAMMRQSSEFITLQCYVVAMTRHLQLRILNGSSRSAGSATFLEAGSCRLILTSVLTNVSRRILPLLAPCCQHLTRQQLPFISQPFCKPLMDLSHRASSCAVPHTACRTIARKQIVHRLEAPPCIMLLLSMVLALCPCTFVEPMTGQKKHSLYVEEVQESCA